MKIIKKDLILTKDTTFNESLRVEGNIYGKNGERFNLTIKGDLDCWNLDCWNLDCWNLNCGDLDCLNLNCGDLDCLNLNFYAVAFAYFSFKCKSVKGLRENSKYFCLDGDVVVNGKVEK